VANPKRQPKGIEAGGQFAPDVNPESTVTLLAETPPEFVLQYTDEHDLSYAIGELSDAWGKTKDLAPEMDDAVSNLTRFSVVYAADPHELVKAIVAVQDAWRHTAWEGSDESMASVDKSVDSLGDFLTSPEPLMTDSDDDQSSPNPDGEGGYGDPKDEDANFYCSTCDLYTDSAEEICADCGNTMREPTRAETKAKYRDAITREFSFPGHGATDYLPNDYGCELLTDSTMTIADEIAAGDGGVMWAGELRIGDKRLSVENRGDGGCNIYRPIFDRADGDDEKVAAWRIEEELNDRVKRGFDGLQNSEALDDFCSIVEVVGEDKT
jgi:hypothetical protein